MSYEDLNSIEGLQFIPVGEKKAPLVKNWQYAIAKYDLSTCWGVGLVCGEPSGHIEALDFDLKYDLTGTLFDRYKNTIQSIDNKLLKKLVVQKTRNGGYHFIYRCKKNEGNVKLANRNTTDEEKSDTYQKTYKTELLKPLADDELAKKVAEKAALNDKVRVLIETRGIGGQIVVAPSEGYQMIYGDLCSITEISPEERDLLFDVARQFNEVFNEVIIPAKTFTKRNEGVSTFDDYDERGDVISLLEGSGWKIVGNKGQKVLFLRPGQTTSQSSGNYDQQRKWFSVFTTSTEFKPETAYKPYAVYTILECNGNFSEASKKLYDLGFGERHEAPKQKESTRVIKSRVDSADEDYSFLAVPEDYETYLQQVIDGTLPVGLTTGSPSLDEHFLFKEGNLVMTNGHDNTGKSVFIWWLLLIAAMYHGWKGIIFSSENTLGSFMRKMIQFYWGKPLAGRFAMNTSEYNIAKEFIERHFFLIKAQEDLYNYKDIINMVKKAKKKIPDLKYGMIDPYNSLKIDLSGFSKLSTHEYHYEALSEIKSFGQQNGFGWFVNHHAVTAALRAKDGEKKYPVAPQKADTEGGGKVSNKADDFLTIHRVTQHPTEWMVTECHIRKIKDTDTGGKVTPFDIPVKFEMYKNGCAFIERLEFGGQPVDPIHSWHLKRGSKQEEIKFPDQHEKTEIPWDTYADTDNEPDPF